MNECGFYSWQYTSRYHYNSPAVRYIAVYVTSIDAFMVLILTASDESDSKICPTIALNSSYCVLYRLSNRYLIQHKIIRVVITVISRLNGILRM